MVRKDVISFTSAVNMAAVRCNIDTSRHHNPENHNLKPHIRENLRSHVLTCNVINTREF
jgi:hypothetical protein